MKTLTFLVPCYNVQSTLRRCLDSMLVADIIDDIEILAINDGSKDNTLDILHEYEEQYPTVVRVIDKPNGGWGTAINIGIREAQGKYLKEVDSDDWVSTKNLRSYMTTLKKTDCDYVATEYQDYFKADDSFLLHTYQGDCYNQALSISDFWSRYPGAWGFPIHAVTFRTELLKEMNLTVGDRYYCDLEYILYPLPFVKTITVLNIPISVYFHGSDEQSTGPAGYKKHYNDYLNLAKRLVVFSNTLPETTISPVRKCIADNVQGVINFAYNLLLSPTYMGKDNIEPIRKDFDLWLKNEGPLYYRTGNSLKKRGLPYLKLWRKLGINILSIKNNNILELLLIR